MTPEAVDEVAAILKPYFPTITPANVVGAKLLLRLNPALAEALDAWGVKHYGKTE